MGVHRPKPTDQPRPEPTRGRAPTALQMAGADLRPKIASSAFVIAISPSNGGDAKQALELGYAILLNKPIVVVVPQGRTLPEGLLRIAHKVIRLRAPLEEHAGQQELMAALGAYAKAEGLEE